MEQNVNSNVTEFSEGLYTDNSPIKQPKGTQRFNLNAVREGHGLIGNEKSNEVLNPSNVPLIEGDVLLGSIYLSKNQFAVFIVSYKDEQGVDLAVPISKIGLFDTISEILTFEVDDETATDKLNFKAENQIQGTFRLRKGCERTIYFVQKDNPPRYYNFDKPYDFQDGNNNFVASKFKLVRSFSKYPIFERLDDDGVVRFGLKVTNNGKLSPGSNSVCFRYVDSDFNATEWITTTEPVIIYHKDYNTYKEVRGTTSSKTVYQNFGETDKALEVSIKASSLDFNFPYFQLGLITADGTTGKVVTVSTSPEIGIQADFSGDNDYYKYTFTGNSSYGVSSESEVLLNNIPIESGRTITQVDNSLLIGNVEGLQIDWCNLQKYASKIETRVVTKDVTLSELGEKNNPANPEAMTEDMSFMPGEIYSIGIVWDFEGGYTSPVYHIPGAAVKDGKVAYLGATDTDYPGTLPFDADNSCADVTYEDNYNCTTEKSYWGKDAIGDPLENAKVRHHRFPLRKTYNKKPIVSELKGETNDLENYKASSEHKIILWIRSKNRKINRKYNKYFNDFTLDIEIEANGINNRISRTISNGEWEASRKNNIKINNKRGGWFPIELGSFEASTDSIKILYISEQPRLFERSTGDNGVRYGWATSGGWVKIPYHWNVIEGWEPNNDPDPFPDEHGEKNLPKFFNAEEMPRKGHPRGQKFLRWDSGEYCCSVVNKVGHSASTIAGSIFSVLWAFSTGEIFTIAATQGLLGWILKTTGYEMCLQQNDDIDIVGNDDVFTQNLFGIKLFNIEVPPLEETNGHKIIGYHLVANKRDEENKTILDSAVTFPMFMNRENNPTYSAYCFHHPVVFKETPAHDKNHLAFINLDYKFLKKQYKNFTFIPEFTLTPRYKASDRYFESPYSMLKRSSFIPNTAFFKEGDTQSSTKTDWILEDVQGGTSYDPSVDKKKEEDNDGFQLYNLVREYPITLTETLPTLPRTEGLGEFTPDAVDYLAPLENIETKYTTNGVTHYLNLFNLSSDNNIGIMTLKADDASKNYYTRGFTYGLLKREIANPYGLFRLLPYYNISKNITPVTYNEATGQYDYETTCENYGGDVFISPMKYVNSLFYDIRNRRRKRKQGVWQIIGGSLAAVASIVVFVIANVFSWGAASALTPLLVSALSASIGLVINGIKIEKANTVYTQLYQLGLKDCIDDEWTTTFLKNPNPEDDQVQWVHEVINSIWFESHINLFWRVETNGYANSFLNPLGHYTHSEYLSYFQNKLTVLDTEHKDGRLYIGFCKAEYYEANLDYLRRNEQKIFYHLPLEYDCCSKCLEKMPHRIIYSESSFQEEKTDNYRKFLPNNYKELGGETGVITNIFNYNDKLFVHTEEALYVVPRNFQEKVIGEVVAFVGSGEFLSLPASKVICDSTGLSAGSQHQWSTLITSKGFLFVDEHSRTIYLYSEQGGLQPISSIGEEDWSKKNIPIKQNEIYRSLYGEDYPHKDNPSSDIGNGYISTYDKEYERFIITKRDLIHEAILEDEDIIDGYFSYNNKLYPRHTAQSKFIIDNTPAGYTFSHIDESTAKAVYTKTVTSDTSYTLSSTTAYEPGEEYHELAYNIVWKYGTQVVDAAFLLDNYNIAVPASLNIDYTYGSMVDDFDIDTFPYTVVNLDVFAVSDPDNPIEGTKYYNTVLNKIFTYTSGSWDAGVEPSTEVYYHNIDTKLTYLYDGAALSLTETLSFDVDDMCVPLIYETSFPNINTIFEEFLGDSLDSLVVETSIIGEDCPYKQLVNITVNLAEVDIETRTICKEWYNYIDKDENGNPLAEPYFELITDEAELEALALAYRVIIYIYVNKLLVETVELPIVTIDDCNNTIYTWCYNVEDLKSTDVVNIYEEIRDKDTDELQYGWFQQITREDDGNYIITNKPKYCTEDPGGGTTEGYFNIIINKCYTCSDNSCLDTMDSAAFDISFVQTDPSTQEVLHTYNLFPDSSTGAVVVPLHCEEESLDEPPCCLKYCGSGAHAYTESEVNGWGADLEDSFTWEDVKAAFDDIAANGNLGWSISIIERGNTDCDMNVTYEYEPLLTTQGESFMYNITNECDCCREKCIDIVKFGVSWCQEVLDSNPYEFGISIGGEELTDIRDNSHPLDIIGEDLRLSPDFLNSVPPGYGRSAGFNPAMKYFFKATVWENIHIACDVYDQLESMRLSGEYSAITISKDSIYEVNDGGVKPLSYVDSHIKYDTNTGKLVLFVLNSYVNPTTDPQPLERPTASVIADNYFTNPSYPEFYTFPPSDCEASTTDDFGSLLMFAAGGLIEGVCTCVEDTPAEITEELVTGTTEDIVYEEVELVPLEFNIVNNSWTKSFDINENRWISYHSYMPNFYLYDNKSFYSYVNNKAGLWKHNKEGLFQTFYGTTYPFIIDYISLSSPLITRVWEYIKFIVDVQIYDSVAEEYVDIENEFFDKIILSNSKQCSGELTIKSKKAVIDKDYFLNQLNENTKNEIIVDRNERNWSINNLRDRRTSYTTPIFLKNLDALQTNYYIDKVVNQSSISFTKDWTELENFRDKYLQIRLIFSNFASVQNTAKNVRMLMNFIIEEEKISNS